MNAVRVAIVAGESSGDALGGALIQALRARLAAIEFRGVAGPAMRAAGCQALADAHELAVMGLIEPLAHLPRLLRLRSKLLAELTAWQPDVFIGIDAPAFNLTLAGRFKARGIATVQYVSPQIWAWRQGRVRKIARRCDLVLCLLPFEPAFYARHAVRAEFVGHPLADQVPLVPDRAAARAALGLPAGVPMLALLPGSRLGEVQRLAAPFIASAVELSRRHPGLQLVAAMANAAVRAEFERALAAAAVPIAAAGAGGAGPQPVTVRVLDGQARAALTAADAALVASGTASLEALLCRCPMVVAYRVSALTAALVRTLRLVRLARFSLPNLLAGEALAPEFFQEAVIPANLCPAIEQALTDTGRREYLQRRFQAIHESLRADGAAQAAQAVLRLLEARAAVGGEERDWRR
ncbi:MAG TPA: lipid-A-disaccharide synthase [Steroidobacteraceae bacterium]|jgi:lipid-A-disaccharide synthase|nr:lipid-A-disaccharide synthase [Steroidobacteraceae bacterium]